MMPHMMRHRSGLTTNLVPASEVDMEPAIATTGRSASLASASFPGAFRSGGIGDFIAREGSAAILVELLEAVGDGGGLRQQRRGDGECDQEQIGRFHRLESFAVGAAISPR
jgi:hypothetical protein